MTDSDYFIGLISGTSIDGVDAALVQFKGNQPQLIDTFFMPMESSLRQKILRLCAGKQIDLQDYASIDIEIARTFASATNKLLAQSAVAAASIKAIGSHGQTVFHQPNGNFPNTLQLGDPNTIAQLTGITTVADFRRRDMAAGGEGAPLAPLLHRNCFHSESTDRVIVNIGGISNITVLNKDGSCAAYDTGPGNVLMDYWIDKHQQKTYDENGGWAATGNANAVLLEQLLSEEYLGLPHPKSTGRELFNGPWLENQLKQVDTVTEAADVQASLLAFTCQSITNEIRNVGSAQEVYVCGGGAHNSSLMTALQTALEGCLVTTTSDIGLDPDWVEAVAFAWMAKETMDGRAIDSCPFTGATQATILGGIYQA